MRGHNYWMGLSMISRIIRVVTQTEALMYVSSSRYHLKSEYNTYFTVRSIAEKYN